MKGFKLRAEKKEKGETKAHERKEKNTKKKVAIKGLI